MRQNANLTLPLSSLLLPFFVSLSLLSFFLFLTFLRQVTSTQAGVLSWFAEDASPGEELQADEPDSDEVIELSN